MLNREEGKVVGGVYTTLKAVRLLSVPQAVGPQFAVGVVMNQFTPAFLGSFATVTFSVTGWPPAWIVEILFVIVGVKADKAGKVMKLLEGKRNAVLNR
jgi:hypothetical protein